MFNGVFFHSRILFQFKQKLFLNIGKVQVLEVSCSFQIFETKLRFTICYFVFQRSDSEENVVSMSEMMFVL